MIHIRCQKYFYAHWIHLIDFFSHFSRFLISLPFFGPIWYCADESREKSVPENNDNNKLERCAMCDMQCAQWEVIIVKRLWDKNETENGHWELQNACMGCKSEIIILFRSYCTRFTIHNSPFRWAYMLKAIISTFFSVWLWFFFFMVMHLHHHITSSENLFLALGYYMWFA